MAASESESDFEFEGFTDENVREASGKLQEKETELEEMIHNDESDIDIDENSNSEEDSDQEEDGEVDPYLVNMNGEWSRDVNEIFVPDFSENTGPQHNLNTNASVLEYFNLFLPQSFFETVANETNRYADQRQLVTGPDPRWRPTTANEIRAYIGMNIMMGVKQLPRIWCYWSTDKRYYDAFISGVMPKTRFLKLNQYIHLRDTAVIPGRDDPDYDPLFKVRPMLDMVSKKFRKAYKPGRDLSVDEAMIGFKGRIHFRQYMPAKPTK
ncbi:piggyBac transposable element-derived protein 4-like [Pecten maximus]|uniref:piggyBac transposable element-derived protein 4-like n=1 Tax=Pecten maximus TaxID=6579 RepID=UPI001458E4F9|nr:piggyBac transposable element-derived protein 4-like [Pecten maximus]